MAWTYSRRVKYYETDRMGVVHHSNYLRFLEDARMEWVDKNLLRYSELEKAGIIIPFVEAHEKFISFLRFDDPFTVTMRLVKHSPVKFTFEYEITNDDTKDVCYRATTTHYYAADGEYRPISMKLRFPELYDKMEAMVEPSGLPEKWIR